MEAAKQSYEEKREELTSFRDEASSILGEKHDRKSQNKRLHDDVKKCEVERHFQFKLYLFSFFT